MKIRSVDELVSFLDSELAWRKRELTTFKLEVEACKRDHLRKLWLRAAVPILYAHWEGYIKLAAQAYLAYVASKGLRYCDLQFNFVAVARLGDIQQAARTKQAEKHVQLVESFIRFDTEQARIPTEGIIDTASNLNSEVLSNVLCTIGLPYDEYWRAKAVKIDRSLLGLRNGIAHGERREVTLDEYRELHELVIDCLEYMKRMVETYCENRWYLRGSALDKRMA